MNKLHKAIAKRRLVTGLVKEAKLRLGDVEDELGEYLGEADEAKVRKMIAKARSKSFSMRHPILTGIPTLGIAPAIANEKAKHKIVRKLLRGSPELRKRRKARDDEDWRRGLEERKLEIEEARANAPARAAAALGAAGVSMAGKMADAKREKAQLKYR